MGNFLSEPITTKQTNEISGSNFKAVCSSMQGFNINKGWRVTMEDAHLAIEDTEEDPAIFAVFDGHGGNQVAKFVQQHFAIELKKNPNYKAKNYEAALKETFYKMDELLVLPESIQEMKKYFKKDKDTMYDDEIHAGCTAVVALLTRKEELIVAHAGDSRCILCRSGTALALTEDHKPNLESEINRITKAGGEILNGRVNGGLNLTRALGDLEYKGNINLPKESQLIVATADTKTINLTSEDEFLLIGCDGIFELKSNEENVKSIRELMNHGKNLKAVIESLLDSLLAPDTKGLGGLDNMTAIIVKLNKRKPSKIYH